MVQLPAHAVGVCAYFIERKNYFHRRQTRAALQALGDMVALAGDVFWPDDSGVNDLASFSGNAMAGHRQVTEAELTKRHKGKVATLDAGLADLLPQTERAGYVAFIGAVCRVSACSLRRRSRLRGNDGNSLQRHKFHRVNIFFVSLAPLAANFAPLIFVQRWK